MPYYRYVLPADEARAANIRTSESVDGLTSEEIAAKADHLRIEMQRWVFPRFGAMRTMKRRIRNLEWLAEHTRLEENWQVAVAAEKEDHESGRTHVPWSHLGRR